MKILKDYVTTRFIREVSEWEVIEPDQKAVELATELNIMYTALKQQFYDNKHIKRIDPKNKEFQDFIKSARMLLARDVDPKQFLLAQIEGLAFTNTFPKTPQLHGNKAFDRYLDYTHKNSDKVKLAKEEKQLFITKSDRETPVRQNPKWLDIYYKMKEGEATYLEVKFIHDVQLLRSGRVSPEILDTLNELKPKKKRRKKTESL